MYVQAHTKAEGTSFWWALFCSWHSSVSSHNCLTWSYRTAQDVALARFVKNRIPEAQSSEVTFPGPWHVGNYLDAMVASAPPWVHQPSLPIVWLWGSELRFEQYTEGSLGQSIHLFSDRRSTGAKMSMLGHSYSFQPSEQPRMLFAFLAQSTCGQNEIMWMSTNRWLI